MTALVFAVVLAAATSAEAAPWSFELPAGYTEQPGMDDEDMASLLEEESVVSADAQTYQSSDGDALLTRFTLLVKLDTPPTRSALESMEREFAEIGSNQATNHISDSRQFAGDQLVADMVDEVDGARVHQRRLYSVDSAGIVHVFMLSCAGSGLHFVACEKAQQTMQLTLPNQAALSNGVPPSRKSTAWRLGYVVGRVGFFVLLIGLAVWVYKRARRGGRRRRSST